MKTLFVIILSMWFSTSVSAHQQVIAQNKPQLNSEPHIVKMQFTYMEASPNRSMHERQFQSMNPQISDTFELYYPNDSMNDRQYQSMNDQISDSSKLYENIIDNDQ